MSNIRETLVEYEIMVIITLSNTSLIMRIYLVVSEIIINETCSY